MRGMGRGTRGFVLWFSYLREPSMGGSVEFEIRIFIAGLFRRTDLNIMEGKYILHMIGEMSPYFLV